MKIIFSKDFEKSVKKLSGKILESVKDAIVEVLKADSIEQLTDCKKLVNYNNIYRLRIGSLRAFFVLYIFVPEDPEKKDNEDKESEDTVAFEYLVSRGEAYSKKITEQLKRKDIN